MSWSRGRGHGARVEGMGAMEGHGAMSHGCQGVEGIGAMGGGSHVGSWSHEPWVSGGRGHGGHAMDMERVHGGGVRAGRAERAGMHRGPLK